MMQGMDKDRLHLWMGLMHPLFGPLNLAVYSAALSTSMCHTMYAAWVQALIDTTYPGKPYGDKSRTPG